VTIGRWRQRTVRSATDSLTQAASGAAGRANVGLCDTNNYELICDAERDGLPEHLLSEGEVVLFLGGGEISELNDARVNLLLIVSPLSTHNTRHAINTSL